MAAPPVLPTVAHSVKERIASAIKEIQSKGVVPPIDQERERKARNETYGDGSAEDGISTEPNSPRSEEPTVQANVARAVPERDATAADYYSDESL